MPKKRLYVVSSPHNALACLAMINQDYARYPDVICEDYAAIWASTWRDFGKTWAIVQITRKMLNSHKFKHVVDFAALEMNMWEDLVKGSIDTLKALVFNALGNSDFDEIYVVRNCQKDRLFTVLSEKAKIICYGETYHKIDSCIGAEFSKIDTFRLVLPVDFTNGLLEIIPLEITPKIYLLDAISSVLEKNPDDKERIIKLNESITTNAERGRTNKRAQTAILALQYLSDIGAMSIDDEVELYIDVVKRSLSKSARIVIKEHPRSLTLEKAGRIRQALEVAGYSDTYVLDRELQHYPIEVICSVFAPDIILSPMSTSLLICKYLFGSNGCMDMDESIATRSGANYHHSLHNVLKEAIDNLDSWNPSDNKPIVTYNGQPIFTIKNGTDAESGFFSLVRRDPIPYFTEVIARIISGLSPATIADMFSKLGFARIALYGVGIIGKILVDKLLFAGRGIELYLIDAQCPLQSYSGLKIHSLQEESNGDTFDAIVVTVMHSYDKIVNDILCSPLRENMIYSFSEILDLDMRRYI